MPLLTPNRDEDRNDFIARCMSDPVMRDDFEDRDQRLAVCTRQWEGNAMDKRQFQDTEQINVGLEIKALEGREFEGHGSVFGNVDLGGDVVMPGAFKRSLADHRTKGTLPGMFWMHQPDQVAGAWKEMHEDEHGLFVKGELADTQLGNEMRTLLQMKAVRGLSIGYRTVDSDFDKDGVRRLKDLDLWEVSIVSLAMNPMAQIEAAKARLSDAGEYVPTKTEFEQSLRRFCGYSKSTSRLITSKVYGDAGAMPGSDHPDRDAGATPGSQEVTEAAELAKLWNSLAETQEAAALALKIRGMSA